MATAVTVIDAVRTPIGKYGGALARVRADDLAAHVIRALIERTPQITAHVDDVVLGATNQAGEDNRNVARMSALLAGLPFEVAGVTVNRLCGSGLEAVNMAARMIALGEARIAIAGGVESMSRAPYVMAKPEQAYSRTAPAFYDTTLGWRFPNPELARRFELSSLGDTAENVATRHGISRMDQDEYALNSHKAAVAAWRGNAFADEVVPIALANHADSSHLGDSDAGDTDLGAAESSPRLFARDESPRPDTSLERLNALEPAFREDGTVTAGNSSPLNDGAAALLLASEDAAQELGLEPMALWAGSATLGVDPSYMGEGPIFATKKLLSHTGLRIPNLDLIELNEAFAAQAIACVRALELDPERVNVNGGALALGHPVGASGARIATTLVHSLSKTPGARLGLATLCIGVGQGIATLFETA